MSSKKKTQNAESKMFAQEQVYVDLMVVDGDEEVQYATKEDEEDEDADE